MSNYTKNQAQWVTEDDTESEYHTRIRATVYLTVRSERALDQQEVHNILSEMHYEFGEDDGYELADGETAYLCATEWEDNEIVSQEQVGYTR